MGLNMKITVMFAFLTMFVCKPLFADELKMQNGDRITGTVVKMENGTLTVKTSYAGDIAVKWDQVESIRTASPVHVVLDDKTSAHGILNPTGTGDLELKTVDVIKPIRFALGQVERINPPSKPAVKFSGRVNVGLDIKKGNTDTKAYHVDSEVEARTENNRYTVGAEANREEESERKTADNRLFYMSYDHFLTQKWFFYTNASFERDDFKDLNLRTTVGAGSGYQFFESEQKNLSLRGGLAYVNTDYSVGVQDDDYTAGRWAVKYDQFFKDV